MKTTIVSTRTMILIVSALLLAGCTAAQVSNTVAAAQQACVSVAPVVAAGAASTNPQAQSIVAYGNAFCGPLMAGNPPPTLDSNSSPWVTALGTALKAIIPIAASALL